MNGILFNEYGLGLTLICFYTILAGLNKKNPAKKEFFPDSVLFLSFGLFGIFSYILNGTLYARPKILIPFLPLFILLLFNPVVLGRYGIKIKVGVPTAIVLSVMVAMLFDLIRTRKVFDVMNGLKDFFKGMGGALSVVVSLIIAGQVFGKGLIAIGAVKTLIDGAQAVGLGAIPMVLAMCLVILVISFLMGSGNAPFFSFAPLIPDIATQWGIHTATFLLPLQTMTGLGRTMSPVTGAIVAVAGMANVSPFRIVKRNAVPLLATTVVCLLVTFILMF